MCRERRCWLSHAVPCVLVAVGEESLATVDARGTVRAWNLESGECTARMAHIGCDKYDKYGKYALHRLPSGQACTAHVFTRASAQLILGMLAGVSELCCFGWAARAGSGAIRL